MSVLTSLFNYKAWSDAELYSAVETLGPDANSDERHNALRLLNHIHVVDKIFAGHLQSKPHGFAATNTPETPTLAELSWASQETDSWYIRHVTTLTAQDLAQQISFTFTDGDAGRMTREELLLHVIAHGTYHRGAVGRILFNQSVTPPRDLFTKFLHTTQLERRAG